MIDINRLVPTQYSLRNPNQVRPMAEHVINCMESAFAKCYLRRFNFESTRLIQIHRIEDTMFLADGHHRVSAIFLAGQDYLCEDQYEIVPMDLSQYLEINFQTNWVTPYNPFTEVRHSNLAEFKRAVNLFKHNAEEAINYIRTRKALYTIPRSNLNHICDVIRNSGLSQYREEFWYGNNR